MLDIVMQHRPYLRVLISLLIHTIVETCLCCFLQNFPACLAPCHHVMRRAAQTAMPCLIMPWRGGRP